MALSPPRTSDGHSLAQRIRGIERILGTWVCRGAHVASASEGLVPVEGGKVWYRAVGDDRGRTPLLLLHGGPGGYSDSLIPIEGLAGSRRVVRYDQLGGGRSERPDDPS